MRLLRQLRFLFCFGLLLGVPAAATDLLVVFGEGDTAAIHNADNFALLGTPTVGEGALRALAIPDPADPDKLLKILILTEGTLVVLGPEPPFPVLGVSQLAAGVADPRADAVLTPDASRLLVISGTVVHVFDTATPGASAPRSLSLQSEATGVAVRIDGERAYISQADTTKLRLLNLASSPPQFLGGPPDLAAEPLGLVAAPNGFAIYALAHDFLFEIDPFANSITAEIETLEPAPAAFQFGPDAPMQTAFFEQQNSIVTYQMLDQKPGDVFFTASDIVESLYPGQGLIHVLTEFKGRIFTIDRNTQSQAPVDNPETGFPFNGTAVDIELGAGGQSLYIAFRDPASIVRMDLAATTILSHWDLPFAPRGIEVAALPGNTATSLEIYGGDEQLGERGTAFARPPAVRVRGADRRPVMGQTVEFSSDELNVTFNPASGISDTRGVAYTRVTPGTDELFEAVALIEPLDEEVTFQINTAPAVREGLIKIDGDYQYILKNNDFPYPLVVEAREKGGPVEDVDITISSPGGLGLISCPAMATTGEDGRASIECAALNAGARLPVTIKIEDDRGRKLEDPFHVIVVPDETDLPVQIVRFSKRNLSGIVGERIPDAMVFQVASGKGQAMNDLGIRFESDGDITFDPPVAPTDSLGVARADAILGCDGGGEILPTAQATGKPQSATIKYTTMTGPPAVLTKTGGDGQRGAPGDQLPQALLAVVTDVCGAALGGQPVIWDVQPPGSAELLGNFSTTNPAGQISTRVKLGNTAARILINAQVGAAATTFRVTANVAPTQILVVEGDGQSVGRGQQARLPLTVETRNNDGAPSGGVPVDFAVVGGSGSLTSERVVTGSDGRASTNIIGGAELGVVVIEARALDLLVQFRLQVVEQVPAVPSGGFVNGASFRGGLVPGSLASIFGTGLTKNLDGIEKALSAPFPTTLGGVRVSVAGHAAPMVSIANINGVEQLNFQVPFEVPAPSGDVAVMIDNNGAGATFNGVQTLAIQPGIFEFFLDPSLFAAALHADFSVVTPANPAKPGEIILLFVTGLGPTDPPVGTNVPGPVPPAVTVNDPSVIVAGVKAEVLGSFYAPRLSTAYQINFRIPIILPSGNATIQVLMSGVESQQSLIPIGE